MTAKIDTHVPASALTLLPDTRLAPPTVVTPQIEQERERRRKEHDERVLRWKAIVDAGGSEAWVKAQLLARGLSVDGDASGLGDKEKGNWKEKKKAEAAERRALKKLAWQAYRTTHIQHLGAGVHWEEGGEPDKFDVENREARALENQLPDLKNAEELAQALGIPVARLRWFTYHRDVDSGTHYRRWSIPKRDGTLRTITSPKKDLKAAQRWSLRQIFEKLPVHGAAHGFLAARSIASNAAVHAGADTIVKLDIKDFFPTITWKRVKGLLRKAGLAEGPATLLALLATEPPREPVLFRGKTHFVATGPRALPQGAPTSPAISNAISMRLDRRMSGLARTFGFRYTRYADDLAFSWRPTEAASRAPVGALLRGAQSILDGEGFQLHPKKTRVLRSGSRQRVTGLIVNQVADGAPAARVPRDVVRRLRAALHNREVGKPGLEGETLSQLRGMAAFIYMTDPKKGQHFLDRVTALESKQAQPQP